MGEQFTCSDFDEFTKIQTPYLYPDGDVVDIFVKYQDSGFILTDLGETIGWLLTNSISNSLSEKKDELIKDSLIIYQVERYKGMLIKRCENAENLSSAVIDLCQAIIRVSDVSFTFSGKTTNSFYQDVADFLMEEKFDFERNVAYQGQSERERKIEFKVINQDNISLIKGLHYTTKSQANSRSDIINSCWSDLQYIRTTNSNINFISLINDELEIPYPENIRLLESNSIIAYWSEKNQLKNLLLIPKD